MASLPVTDSQFRTDFPAFADPTRYPPQDVGAYLAFAGGSFDARRWGQFLVLGIELFTAHFLTLDAQDVAASARGGVPGQQSGPVSAKSVGAVSASYDLAASSEENAGHWNLTTFGKRYLRFAKMAGAGPVQISGGGRLGNPPWYFQNLGGQ